MAKNLFRCQNWHYYDKLYIVHVCKCFSRTGPLIPHSFVVMKKQKTN
jgi:hypothetical protein